MVAVAPVLRPGGTLDYILGELNIEAGTGENTLNVSDRNDPDPDTNVVITQASILGLAPADIHYAATGGTYSGQGKWNLSADFGEFGRGINLYGGTGGNTISVSSTHTSGPLFDVPFGREITSLFAGRGGDMVTVAVADDPGRYLVIRGEAGGDTIDASASSLSVTIFGDEGLDTITGGSNADILLGDEGRIYYLRPASGEGYDIVLGGEPVDDTTALTNDDTFLTVDHIRTTIEATTDDTDSIQGPSPAASTPACQRCSARIRSMLNAAPST